MAHAVLGLAPVARLPHRHPAARQGLSNRKPAMPFPIFAKPGYSSSRGCRTQAFPPPVTSGKEKGSPAGGGTSGGGGGSGGGGSDDGGANEGSSDGDEEEDGGLSRNIWVLLLAAGSALALFTVGSKKLRVRSDMRQWIEGLDLGEKGKELQLHGKELQQLGKEWVVARKKWLQAQAAQLDDRQWPQLSDLQKEVQRRKEWVQAKVQATSAATRGPPPASSEDVAALTRLTKEAFADLVVIKGRLDALEEDAGLASSSAAPTDATPVAASSSSGARVGGAGAAAAVKEASAGQQSRHRLSGVVRLGGGLMWAEDGAEEESSEMLGVAGVKLGTDVLLQLAGLLRGGRDSIRAECKVDTTAERLTLRKVVYSSRLGSHLRLVLSPFGARGHDAAYTLNPLAGQGLSSMVRDGSPLHRPVLGSLVGLGLEASRAWLNAGYFARASTDGLAACSLLAQAVVAPFNSLSIGATYLEHRSEAGGAGVGDNGAEAGSNGGLQRPAMMGALQRFAPLAAAVSAATGSASVESDRQLGAVLALKLGDLAVLHGWAAADGDEVERRVRDGQLADVRPKSWGLLLGSYPDGSGNGWTCGMGRLAEADGSGSGNVLVPNLLELSMQFDMGDGLLLLPGMLVTKQSSGRHTAFLGMKSQWMF